jgi:biotin carboxylase
MAIREAARGWCDLIWLIDGEDPTAIAVLPLLRRFGAVVDALAAPPNAAAAALREHSPDGLASFYDTGMEHVALIAAELRLPFHSATTGRALEDKLYQREAFRNAGLPTPQTRSLPADADRATVERIAAPISFPVVLKPRRASGSWHTFAVPDAHALGELWDELAAYEPEERLIEEYLPDGPPMPAGFEADYVSIETIVVGGEMTHLAITGRFPLAPPLRETGYFIPSTVGPAGQDELLEVTSRALRALGVEVGCTHTEIKLTAEGPRVIEVNGRVGGGVPDMLELAGGVAIVKLAMRAALGLAPGVSGPVPTTGVGYRFFAQPPLSARRVLSVDGLERVKALPGVTSVYLHHPPGTELDGRDGTRAYVYAVVGKADDHPGMVAVERFLRDEVEVVYEHA